MQTFKNAKIQWFIPYISVPVFFMPGMAGRDESGRIRRKYSIQRRLRPLSCFKSACVYPFTQFHFKCGSLNTRTVQIYWKNQQCNNKDEAEQIYMTRSHVFDRETSGKPSLKVILSKYKGIGQ